MAVLVIDLHFPDAGSLKAKRKELSSVKAQLHGRLGAAVSEIDHQDTVAACDADGGADRRVGGGALARAADRVERLADRRAVPTECACSGSRSVEDLRDDRTGPGGRG